jgi:hypothetical protein
MPRSCQRLVLSCPGFWPLLALAIAYEGLCARKVVPRKWYHLRRNPCISDSRHCGLNTVSPQCDINFMRLIHKTLVLPLYLVAN